MVVGAAIRTPAAAAVSGVPAVFAVTSMGSVAVLWLLRVTSALVGGGSIRQLADICVLVRVPRAGLIRVVGRSPVTFMVGNRPESDARTVRHRHRS